MADHTHTRTASCACGGLKVTTRSEPISVYVCSCLDCQRKTGSAFSFCATYRKAAVSITGEHRPWRKTGDAGRWVEFSFCPTCGGSVFAHFEALPDLVGVSAGCFADPQFAMPGTHYWASRQHRWLGWPEDTEAMATQPD